MIFGHQKNLKIISEIIKKNNLPHAILFAGPNHIGKRTIAIELIKYLSGEHKEDFFTFSKAKCSCRVCRLIEKNSFPDLIEIQKTNGQISIDEIREFSKKSLNSPNYRFNFLILNNAENLSSEAAGALLKKIEEPKKSTIFFFLTAFPNLLPKTILSRLSIFKFNLLSKEEINVFINNLNLNFSPEGKRKIIDISLGRPGIAKEISIDKKKLIYYNSLLENINNIHKLSLFEKLSFCEALEKEGKTNDFLFLIDFWIRDLLVAKKKIKIMYFEFMKKEIQKVASFYPQERIENILKTIIEIKKYILFSNVSSLLVLENLILQF